MAKGHARSDNARVRRRVNHCILANRPFLSLSLSLSSSLPSQSIRFGTGACSSILHILSPHPAFSELRVYTHIHEKKPQA